MIGLVYPGANAARATKGAAVAERTAAEIWAVLARLESPPLLWNVFPFHPHERDSEMTNRKFSSRELAMVSELNHDLVNWLGIKRIVCIGQDAAVYAKSFGVEVDQVRHPSYGGTTEFRVGMKKIYGGQFKRSVRQSEMF
jgi:hypothetical protein